ncbi:Transcriptional activator spt7 [Nosema granulosis]|uniref:Transcriptional activator spt7 n=1 Tax=Nosema granulosis TaxID=83296 RepID=A0A9P6H0W7_9MICR|nr:Transcriptional activator spt7 [Nosema granulosis]
MVSKKIDSFLIGILERDEKYKSYLDKYYNLPKKMNRIITNLKLYKESAVFLNKVTKKEAPDYHTIIKKPIDIGTIQKKIPKYNSYSEFREDLDLIWTNCYTYNAGPFFIYCADTMKRAVETQEIPRIPVEKDPGFVGFNLHVEGLESRSQIKREDLKKVVAEIIKNAGFESSSLSCLEILCDVLEDKICSSFKEHGKNW